MKRTDFKSEPPERGEWLAYDYYANGNMQCVVRVQKVKSDYFVIDGKRKADFTGKIIGYEHAIVRRSPKIVKEHRRSMAERRLMCFDYQRLPGSVLKALNQILDAYEIQSQAMKAKYAVAGPGTDIGGSSNQYRGQNQASKQPGRGLKGRSKASEPQNTAKTVSRLEDSPKSTWGAKHRKRKRSGTEDVDED